MARTAVTVSDLTINGNVDISGTVTTRSTGTNGWAVAYDNDATILLVHNSGSVTGAIEIKAPTSGDYTVNKGVGDLSVTVGGGIRKAIKVEGSRFRQSDGKLSVDGVGGNSAGFTGSLQAIDPEAI